MAHPRTWFSGSWPWKEEVPQPDPLNTYESPCLLTTDYSFKHLSCFTSIFGEKCSKLRIQYVFRCLGLLKPPTRWAKLTTYPSSVMGPSWLHRKEVLELRDEIIQLANEVSTLPVWQGQHHCVGMVMFKTKVGPLLPVKSRVITCNFVYRGYNSVYIWQGPTLYYPPKINMSPYMMVGGYFFSLGARPIFKGYFSFRGCKWSFASQFCGLVCPIYPKIAEMAPNPRDPGSP